MFIFLLLLSWQNYMRSGQLRQAAFEFYRHLLMYAVFCAVIRQRNPGSWDPPFFEPRGFLKHCFTPYEKELTKRNIPSRFLSQFLSSRWEAQWPHGQCARLRSEWSGFEPWPGTLCCVLGQDTLLSQCLSPPRCINGTCELLGKPSKIAGEWPAMD